MTTPLVYQNPHSAGRAAKTLTRDLKVAGFEPHIRSAYEGWRPCAVVSTAAFRLTVFAPYDGQVDVELKCSVPGHETAIIATAETVAAAAWDALNELRRRSGEGLVEIIVPEPVLAAYWRD